MMRFWAKVDRRSPDECWTWLGGLRNGYGLFWADGVRVSAHRYAYELLVAPIPGGLTIDHLCHSLDPACAGGDGCPHRACVNPQHLEPVTQAVNNLRSPNNIAAQHAAKTHCIHGHEFTPENTVVRPRGGRGCRACNVAVWTTRTEYRKAYYENSRQGLCPECGLNGVARGARHCSRSCGAKARQRRERAGDRGPVPGQEEER